MKHSHHHSNNNKSNNLQCSLCKDLSFMSKSDDPVNLSQSIKALTDMVHNYHSKLKTKKLNSIPFVPCKNVNFPHNFKHQSKSVQNSLNCDSCHNNDINLNINGYYICETCRKKFCESCFNRHTSTQLPRLLSINTNKESITHKTLTKEQFLEENIFLNDHSNISHITHCPITHRTYTICPTFTPQPCKTFVPKRKKCDCYCEISNSKKKLQKIFTCTCNCDNQRDDVAYVIDEFIYHLIHDTARDKFVKREIESYVNIERAIHFKNFVIVKLLIYLAIALKLICNEGVIMEILEAICEKELGFEIIENLLNLPKCVTDKVKNSQISLICVIQKLLSDKFKIFDHYNWYEDKHSVKKFSINMFVILISNEDVCIKSENSVWLAISYWISANIDIKDLPDNKKECSLLCKALKIEKMDISYIMNVICQKPWIKNNIICRSIIKALKYFCVNKECLMTTPAAKKRCSYNFKFVFEKKKVCELILDCNCIKSRRRYYAFGYCLRVVLTRSKTESGKDALFISVEIDSNETIMCKNYCFSMCYDFKIGGECWKHEEIMNYTCKDRWEIEVCSFRDIPFEGECLRGVIENLVISD